MKLIGKEQVNATPGDHSLYVELFDRLPKEVRGVGGMLRYVGYESCPGHIPSVRFL